MIKESGKMKQALVDWDAKDDMDKTRMKTKAYSTKKDRNRNKDAIIKAKQARETPSNYIFNKSPERFTAVKHALAAKIAQQV